MEFTPEQITAIALVFFARVADVSLGTVRTILVLRGHKYPAGLVGFVEILIWVFAAARVLKSLDEWYLGVAYAGGFATGTVVGVYLEGWLGLGTEMVRAVSRDPDTQLAARLQEMGYEVIELNGEGSDGSVEVLLVVSKRRRMPALLRAIDSIDPEAFYTISDVREKASQYPGGGPRAGRPGLWRMGRAVKRK